MDPASNYLAMYVVTGIFFAALVALARTNGFAGTRPSTNGSPFEMNLSAAEAAINGRKATHLEWIDVFRGIAALWVIVYHSRVDLWVGFREIHRIPGSFSKLDILLSWLSLPAACGGSAVMLFFIISGFCVHLPYVTSNLGPKPPQYCLRRAFRILPPYLFAVALTCVLEWLAYLIGGPSPTPFHRVARVATLTQNYGDAAGQLLTNGALWSLPVEVEFYIAYLLFYFVLKSCNRTFTLIFISALSLAATIGYLLGLRALDQNFLRFWAIWCAGALLAEWFKPGRVPEFKRWNGAVFVAVSLTAVWAVHRQWPLGMLAYLWAAVYFHVVWFVLINPNSLYKFPKWSVRLFVWLGTISYSAYLIHSPVFKLCGFLWIHYAGAKPACFLVPLFFSIAIWPAAWLFWKVCEYPFHQISRRMAKISPAPSQFDKANVGRNVFAR